MLTFRDYLRIYFRHKPIIITVFLAIIGAVYYVVLSWTPVYEAEVSLLITAQKKIEASYYQDAGSAYGVGESTVGLTQCEIMSSTPVLKRAVEALKLHERPRDYEKRFASPFKVLVLDLQESIRSKLDRVMRTPLSPDLSGEMLVQKTVQDLRENIEVTTVKNTNMLRMTVKDYDPLAAARIANVISRSYIIFDLEQQLAEYQLKYGITHEIVQQLLSDVARLIGRIDKEPRSTIESIGPASVKIIAPATVPLEPQKALGKKRGLIMVVVIFLAAFASLSLAMLVDYLDQTFKSPRELTAALPIPYLGFLPKRAGSVDPPLVPNASGTPYVKAYHKLADQLFLLMKDRGVHTVLLTSALAEEGTGEVATNLGRLFPAKFSRSALIIDADLRDPVLQRSFGLGPHSGLADVLADRSTLNESVQETGPGLGVLTAGGVKSEDPLVLLSSSKWVDLLQQAKRKYPVILINTPPAGEFKDAELLSAHTDAGIFIIAEGGTRRQVALNALSAWNNPKFTWLGVVLNRRRLVIPAFLYPWT